MPVHQVTVLVLVADGGEARLLRAKGRYRTRPMVEIEHMNRPSAHLAARNLTSDAHGRVFASAGRGGIGPRVSARGGAGSDYDPHTVEIERFARRISARIDELRRGGQFERLIVIAAPKFLGVLRATLRVVTRRLISREIAHDLVHAREPQIRRLAFEI